VAYRFRCLGPYNFKTHKDINGDRTFCPRSARNEVFEAACRDANRMGMRDVCSAVGLYVFGLSPSGGEVTWPYYVGRASTQELYARLFQTTDKPRKYSAILREYEKARPLVYLFPLVTQAGNLARKTKRGSAVYKIIEDAEYMMIGHAMSVNPFLHNVQNVISREKFIIDGTPPAIRRETNAARSFRKMMGFESVSVGGREMARASRAAYVSESDGEVPGTMLTRQSQKESEKK